MRRLTFAAAIVGVTAGCGADPKPAPTTQHSTSAASSPRTSAMPGPASSTHSSTSAAGPSFASTDEIVSALAAAGHPCAHPVPHPDAMSGSEAVACELPSGVSTFLIVRYESKTAADLDADAFAFLTSAEPGAYHAVITGANWQVFFAGSGARTIAPECATRLHGQLRATD